MEYGLLKFSHILGAVLSAPGLSAFGWPTSARASSASLSRSQHGNTLQQWALHGRFSVWQSARNQRLKAPYYALKSATKVPNPIDFAGLSGDS